MNEEELRDRLRRIDPAPSEDHIEPPTSASARALRERIMNTDTTTDEPAGATAAGRAERRTWLLASAAALLVVAGGLAVVLLGGGDDGADDVATGPPLALSLPAGDMMASCLPVDAAVLADMPTAFAGTATAIEGERVTLDVDRWYTDGDAGTVELHATSGQVALNAGFEFQVGERYLVSATDGTVNLCGFSGPATPELTELFEEAFGS